MGNRNFIVGVFVSFAIAAIVVLTLWLSGRAGNQETTTYSMYFERDVSGLMLGGPVFYLGVQVGNVVSTRIIPGDPMSVRVDIRVLDSTPVDTGTWASLYYQGITGVAVINLSGDPGMNLPLKRAPGESNPVIEVRDAGLAAVLADAPVIMRRLDNLLERASRILGGENQGLITDTLTDLRAIADTMADDDSGIAKLSDEVKATLVETRAALDLLRGMMTDVRPDMAAAFDQLAAASANLATMTERLEQWTADNEEDVDVFLSGGLAQIPELIADSRAALREMEKLMQSLREDPSRLIYRPSDGNVDQER